MAEGAVVKACIQWLVWHQCDIIRNNSGAIKTAAGHYLRFGKKGTGDILAISPYGRWIEVEAKSATGDMRALQLERQKLIQSKGGVYIICRNSADALDDMKSEILAIPSWNVVPTI